MPIWEESQLKARQTLSVLVKDRPGVLQRVCSLFSRRGFNIASIAVGHAERPGQSRMTIVTSGDEHKLRQIKTQLDKLIDVIAVDHLVSDTMVDRELALIKVRMEPDQRNQLLAIIEVHRGTIIDIHPQQIIVQVVGSREQIRQVLQELQVFGVIQISRTGLTALERGSAR